jgi:general secretion pathway protein L
MRLDALARRWLDALAGLALDLQELWRARRSLVVSCEGGGFVLRQPGRGARSVPAAVPAGTRAPDAALRAARRAVVTLELPPDKVLAQRITVPAKGREFLAGIVRNQIERLSPWQAEHAAYGFQAETGKDDAATLDVRVMITSRPIIDRAREEVAAIGLAVDRIVARDAGASPGSPVVLWSSRGSASPERLRRARWVVGTALGSILCLGFGLGVWADATAGSIRDESEEVAARARALQQRLQASRAPRSAAKSEEERAWALKETSPSAVAALEALSRLLPGNAHLTELDRTSVV